MRVKANWAQFEGADLADQLISVIGAGSIGQQVIGFIGKTPGFSISRILTKNGTPDTADTELFFTEPAGLFIETAGPSALRKFGARALAVAELWTVSASALADDSFRQQLIEVGNKHGNVLRLFSPWIPGIGHDKKNPSHRLHIRQSGPQIGDNWAGSLREAVLQFPDDLNSATAAALCGPGIDATSIELIDTGPSGAYRFEAVLSTKFGRFESCAEFMAGSSDIHPTAAAIESALRNERRTIQYG
ncbi:MAG: hypothetical protein AB3N20_01390 [Rhizobiaceae bacterium]